MGGYMAGSSVMYTTIAYLRKNGKTLFLYRNKRKRDVHQGKYIGLGGKFEVGETAADCMIREVKEESGLEVLKYQQVGEIYFPAFDGEIDIYMYLFEVTAFQGELIESEEGSLHWIQEDEISKLPLWEGDHLFLNWMYEKRQYFKATFYYNDGNYQRHVVEFGEKYD